MWKQKLDKKSDEGQGRNKETCPEISEVLPLISAPHHGLTLHVVTLLDSVFSKVITASSSDAIFEQNFNCCSSFPLYSNVSLFYITQHERKCTSAPRCHADADEGRFGDVQRPTPNESWKTSGCQRLPCFSIIICCSFCGFHRDLSQLISPSSHS